MYSNRIQVNDSWFDKSFHRSINIQLPPDSFWQPHDDNKVISNLFYQYSLLPYATSSSSNFYILGYLIKTKPLISVITFLSGIWRHKQKNKFVPITEYKDTDHSCIYTIHSKKICVEHGLGRINQRTIQ